MLSLGDWEIDFAPEAGGSLRRCEYRGVKILKAARGHETCHDPRMLSAFPMVPFIGRIERGVFAFQGHMVQLSPNMPPEPHAIHGLGWQSEWDITIREGTSVSLTHTHDGQSDWPWAYKAEQVFSTHEHSLTWTMTLTNQSVRDMPAGLGWHPYFPIEGAQIQADVTSIWNGQEDGAIEHTPQVLEPDTDLRSMRPVKTLDLDHCFSAGDGGVQLHWPERGVKLRMSASSALRHLTVYTPSGEPYFCVEPVSHMPNAINSQLRAQETGLKVLKPGANLQADITLTVQLDKSF